MRSQRYNVHNPCMDINSYKDPAGPLNNCWASHMASFSHLLVVLIIGISANTSFADTMYKSIRPDGKIVYSDRPPAEGRIEKTITFENLPSSTLPKQTSSYVEQLKKLRASAPVVASRESIVLYSATWCGYCAKAKAYLAGKGISYEVMKGRLTSSPRMRPIPSRTSCLIHAF